MVLFQSDVWLNYLKKTKFGSNRGVEDDKKGTLLFSA